MVRAAVTLDDLGRQKLGPGLEEAGKAVDGFGREKVGPAVEKTGKWVGGASGGDSYDCR